VMIFWSHEVAAYALSTWPAAGGLGNG